MWWLILGCTIPSMIVCWAASFAVRRLGPRWGLVDHPGHRKIHAKPMPTGGGLAIWLGIVLPLAVGQVLLWGMIAVIEPKQESSDGSTAAAPMQIIQTSIPLPDFVLPHLAGLRHQSGKLWVLLAGGTVLMLLGLADDRRRVAPGRNSAAKASFASRLLGMGSGQGLDWRFRLFVQTVVAGVLVSFGWRMTLFVDMPWLTGTLSVLWIVGLVNSFNMLDNMDGLSAGVAAIAAAMFAAMMLFTHRLDNNQPQLFVAGLLLVVVGSLLGFLWHNRPPARLFMGDAGSYSIGYLLAMTTLMGTFSGGNLPKHAIFGPLCVLAVPLYDTITVVFIRLSEGRSPFTGDKSHFSHRLVELGLSKPKAVLTIYLTTATCGLGALLLRQLNAFGASIVLLMVTCTLALVAILETSGRRRS